MRVLALDVGGSAIKYGVCSEDAGISFKGEALTPLAPEDTAETFVEAVKAIADHVRAEGGEFEGLALSVPGCVNRDGSMRTGGALRYNEGQPIADMIEEAVGMRPAIENDAKAAAAAELWLGSMRGVGNGLVLLFGTGLGGGIIVDGRVVQGATGAAGELSAFNLDMKYFANGMNTGADLVSTTALVIAACEALHLPYRYDGPKGIREFPLDGRRIFEMHAEGNEQIRRVISDFGFTVGKLVYNVSVILDLERVAIGGGISAQECLIDAVREGTRNAFRLGSGGDTENPLLRCPEVEVCRFRNDANLIGAMHHYMVVNGIPC